MQQRDSRTNIDISEETRKDSSAMKSLALITTIFLPTTALAVRTVPISPDDIRSNSVSVV